MDVSARAKTNICAPHNPSVGVCQLQQKPLCCRASQVAAIEAEMRATPATAVILAALHATRTSARDRQNAMERSIREEARKLRQVEGGESMDLDGEPGAAPAARAAAAGAAPAAGGAAAGRSVIDLESLVFNQGGHFMSNKGCTLPPGSYRFVLVGLAILDSMNNILPQIYLCTFG